MNKRDGIDVVQRHRNEWMVLLNGKVLHRAPTEVAAWAWVNDVPHARIVAAAIRVGDLICVTARPNRHHHVLQAMEAAGVVRRFGPEQRGFITSDGRFVNRQLAREIALRAGQISKTHDKPELFSEDLW